MAGPHAAHIIEHYVDVLRSRRKRLSWSHAETNLYSRHRRWVEGAHGLAKTLHGMARAARRGLENMKIQALLTATAINPKRLAKPKVINAVVSHADRQSGLKAERGCATSNCLRMRRTSALIDVERSMIA
jgi:hypothetical protein